MGRLLEKLRDPEEQKELLRYAVSGVATTCVNLLSFALFSRLFGMEDHLFWNSVSIVLSILFAYFMNRVYVFRSDQPFWTEFLSFIASRALISLVFDNGAVWLLYDLLGFRVTVFSTHLVWAKVLGQLFVVAGNYLVGKFFVFQRHKR